MKVPGMERDSDTRKIKDSIVRFYCYAYDSTNFLILANALLLQSRSKLPKDIHTFGGSSVLATGVSYVLRYIVAQTNNFMTS